MKTHKIEFVQGDDYREAGRILDEEGEDALFIYLLSLDGPTSEVITSRRDPWGTEDTVVWFTPEGQRSRSPHRLGHGYVLSYNERLGYAGLTRILEGWPYTDANGRTLWACCESTIGPTCQHRTEPTS